MGLLTLQQLDGGVASGGVREYTVPNSVQVRVLQTYVLNPDTADHTFRMAMIPAGESLLDPDSYIYYDVNVTAKMTRVLAPLHLSGGDTLRFEDASDTLVVTFFGESLG